MNRSAYIWLLLFTGNWLWGHEAADPGNRNLLSSVRVPKVVVPGQYSTFIFQIDNTYEFPLQLRLTVDKPENWHLISKMEEFAIAPGESRKIVILMEVGKSCDAGEQELAFRFKDERKGIALEEKVVTEVQIVHNLEVQIAYAPAYVESGKTFEVKFEISNRGNCTENFSVSTENGQYVDSKYKLEPNSTKYINVSGKAPEDLDRVSRINVGISLQVDYQKEPIRLISSIKAYPRKTRKSDRFHRLPIELSLIYFGAKTGGPFEGNIQLEAKGNGFMDAREKHHVSFTMRGPNRFTIARVGNYDQYSLQYTHHAKPEVKTQVRLGDYGYNLTDLTEMFRWARGVGIDHQHKRLEVGVFYNEPRFLKEVDYQYAAYAAYAINPKIKPRLSAMRKHFAEFEAPATLFSLGGDINLKNQLIKTEISSGHLQGRQSYSAMLQYEATFKRFAARTQNIYADANFPGFYSNSIFSNTFLNYRQDRWGLNASFAYNESNPRLDTIFSISPYAISNRLGFSWHPGEEIRQQIYYTYRFREDRFPEKRFSYREHGMRYILSYKTRIWDAQFDMEAAQTQNLLAAPENSFATTYLARLRATRQMREKWQLGGFAQYLYSNRYSVERQSNLLYGANTSLKINENYRLGATYRNSYLLEEYTHDRTLLDLYFSAYFKRHEFTLIGSHSLVRNTLSRTDFFLSARYTFRFGAPIARKSGLYSLRGKIHANRPEDAGGIIVNIGGQSVITDATGVFEVNDIPAGPHYLYVDQGSLNFGYITDIPTPYEVAILPEENNQVDFNVLKAAQLRGHIDFKISKSDEFNGLALPRIIIKLYNDQQEFLTYSDENGNFSFMNLLPGEWKIRVVDDQKDEWMVMNNTKTINLQAGEKQEVNFRIHKKERAIKFNNQKVKLQLE